MSPYIENKISHDLLEKAEKMWMDNIGFDAISRVLNCHETNVRRVGNRLGWPKRGVKKKPRDVVCNDHMPMPPQNIYNMTFADIADEEGIPAHDDKLGLYKLRGIYVVAREALREINMERREKNLPLYVPSDLNNGNGSCLT